jgi:hypothetical protein
VLCVTCLSGPLFCRWDVGKGVPLAGRLRLPSDPFGLANDVRNRRDPFLARQGVERAMAVQYPHDAAGHHPLELLQRLAGGRNRLRHGLKAIADALCRYAGGDQPPGRGQRNQVSEAVAAVPARGLPLGGEKSGLAPVTEPGGTQPCNPADLMAEEAPVRQ